MFSRKDRSSLRLGRLNLPDVKVVAHIYEAKWAGERLKIPISVSLPCFKPSRRSINVLEFTSELTATLLGLKMICRDQMKLALHL